MAIEKSDLRKGNFVEVPNDEHLICETLTVDELNRNDARLCRSCGCCYQDVIYEDISPVPIDEEWLIRLGFVDIDHGIGEIIYHSPFLGAAVRLQYNRYFYSYGTEDLREVKFIHQLQNVHYWVTDHELAKEQ